MILAPTTSTPYFAISCNAIVYRLCVCLPTFATVPSIMFRVPFVLLCPETNPFHAWNHFPNNGNFVAWFSFFSCLGSCRLFFFPFVLHVLFLPSLPPPTCFHCAFPTNSGFCQFSPCNPLWSSIFVVCFDLFFVCPCSNTRCIFCSNLFVFYDWCVTMFVLRECNVSCAVQILRPLLIHPPLARASWL